MDTLLNDLLNLLSNHFDVLPTVFLTNKQLELEDAGAYNAVDGLPAWYNRSVYEQENWPWILTNLKFGFVPTEACAQDGDKHRIFEFIDEIASPKDPLPYINSIYQYAHLYNQKKLIKRYSGRKSGEYIQTMSIYYAVLGGHLDLLSKHLNNISRDTFFVDVAFKNGNPDIINLLNLGSHDVESWISDALVGAIEGNQLDLLKDLMEKYHNFINSDLIGDIMLILGSGPKTYDTLVWLYESKHFTITSKYSLVNLLEDIVASDCQLRLFQWIVNYFSNLIDEPTKHSIVVNALKWNRLDCALCLQTAVHRKDVWVDEATILSSLTEQDLNIIKMRLVEYGCRKLYNKLIQN